MALYRDIQFDDHERSVNTYLANRSLRHCRLESFERWAKGTQYEGLQSWWDDSNDVPLWERAPCIVYPVVDIAANSNVDLCLGEGRFPAFSTKPSEDDTIDESGLSEDESGKLDKFIKSYHRISKFRAHARGAFYGAQTTGSVTAIHGIRNGRPFNELVPAKWCEPELDAEGVVLKLRIQYPYVEEYRKPNGKWAKRTRLYRREITDTDDIEYFPADARDDGVEPDWVKNKARSVKHNLGFCPVVWYPLMKGATTINVIDGDPIHRHITDEIYAHDIARSQWHRGALLSEPQVCEYGVAPGYNPTEVGRTALIPSTENGGLPDLTINPETGKPRNPINGAFVDGGSRRPKPARKKGPGWIWQYGDPNSRVELLQYPEGALAAQENNVRDLRIKLQESLCVVFLDPENIKFAATTSGKALQAIKQKQIDRCDQFRDDLAENFFEPSISMQLRLAEVVLGRGQMLRVPGAQSILPILSKFRGENDNLGSQWQSPVLTLSWGPYFKQDAQEQQQIVQLVKSALEDTKSLPVITLKMAVQKIADSGVFPIDNIQAVVDEILKDAEKKTESAVAAVAAPEAEPNPEGAEPDPDNDDPDEDNETERAA